MLAQERIPLNQAPAVHPAWRAGWLPCPADAASAAAVVEGFRFQGASVRREAPTVAFSVPHFQVPDFAQPAAGEQRGGRTISDGKGTTGKTGNVATVAGGRITPQRGSAPDHQMPSHRGGFRVTPHSGWAGPDQGQEPTRGCDESHPSRSGRAGVLDDRGRPSTRPGPLSWPCSTALTRPEGVLEA